MRSFLTRNHAFDILAATSRVDGSARYTPAKRHFFSTKKRVLSFAVIYPIVLMPQIIEYPRISRKMDCRRLQLAFALSVTNRGTA